MEQEQNPSRASSVPFTYILSSSQSTGSPPTQVPLGQVSLSVQAFPSSHGSPLGNGMARQPEIASHVPVTQAPSRWEQSTDAPGTQVPPEHASPSVQALPSEHWLLSFGENSQPDAGLQVSSVHLEDSDVSF